MEDIVLSNLKSLYSSSYISIIIFFLILLIGFFVGFINGIRTSLYFLIFNIVIIGIYFAIKKPFDDFMKKIYSNLGWSITKNQFFYPIVYATYLLFVNSFIINIYFFFRKKLKQTIRFTKQEGRSIIFSRIGGGLIAVLTSLPFAIVIMQIFVVIFGSDTFTNYVTNYLFRYLTLENIEEYSNIELSKYVEYWKKIF